MISTAKTVDEYIAGLPPERQSIIAAMRQQLLDHLPEGFEEGVGYGMIGFDVPHSIYPAGYHCDPKQPLPFIGMASQKNHIALYHMGLAAGMQVDWFVEEFAKVSKKKLDMGKSCIRFKKPEDVPLELIGRLAERITVEEWIEVYEREMKKG